MFLYRYYLFAFWIAGAGLFAQDTHVKVSTSRDSISIGETLVYTLTITQPSKARILNEPSVDFSDFEITQIKKYESSEENDHQIQRIDYILTTFNIDTFLIPAPTVHFLLGKDTLSASGQSKLIIVTSSIDTSFKDIRPEKPIVEGEVNWWLLSLYATLVLAAAAGFFYLGIRLYRRYRHRKLHPAPHTVPEIIRLPEEVAMEALNKLKEKSLVEKGEYKQFHVEASDIIRLYVEGKFYIQALESTTSELILEFRQKRLMEENYVSLLRRFLEVCDLVKFAKYKPSNEECIEVFNEAVGLVKYSPTNK